MSEQQNQNPTNESLWTADYSVLWRMPNIFKVFPMSCMTANEKRNASLRLVILITIAMYLHNSSSRIWWAGIGLIFGLMYMHTQVQETFYSKASLLAENAMINGIERKETQQYISPVQDMEIRANIEQSDMQKAKSRISNGSVALSEDLLDRKRKAEQMITNAREQPTHSVLTWTPNEQKYSTRAAFKDTNDEYDDLYMRLPSGNIDKYVSNRAG